MQLLFSQIHSDLLQEHSDLLQVLSDLLQEHNVIQVLQRHEIERH